MPRHAHDLVGIEVGLLDTPILDRDLAIECGRGAEDDSALDLRFYRVGIDDCPAIDRAHDTANADRAFIRDLNLGDMRQIAAEYIKESDVRAKAFAMPPPAAPSSRCRRRTEPRPA